MRPITRAERRNILERFREQYGDNRISTLEQRHIVKLLSRLKPAASRNWLKALRALLDFAVAEGFRPDNPAASIKFRKYRAKSHHAWTAQEIEQFEAYWPIGSKPRLALALLLHTAQRRGDVVRMGARHIRGNGIYVKQQKTGAELQVPISAELRAVLQKTPVPARHTSRVSLANGFGASAMPRDCPSIASRTASDMPPPLGWPRRGRARIR